MFSVVLRRHHGISKLTVSEFYSWASENRSLVDWRASEVSLSSLVSDNVSLINDTFHTEAISDFKTNETMS